jgi:hypothetical protein
MKRIEDDEVIFTKSTKGLINGAVKRGLREIRKYAAINNL